MQNDIVCGVIINLITILITSIVIVVAYYAKHVFRGRKSLKDNRRYMKPSDRVIRFDGELHSSPKFEVLDKSKFNRVLTEDEQKYLLSQTVKGKNLTNGKCVRLDSVTDGVFKLSQVRFFDFMTTNLIAMPGNVAVPSLGSQVIDGLTSDVAKEVNRLENRVRTSLYGQRQDTFEDVLAINELANIVTVSVVLTDCTGRSLIVRRGNKVAVGSGNFATSCAGSVAVDDLTTDNPFLSCAERELKEELNLECKLIMTDLVISKQKLQPAVLFAGTISESFEEVYDKMIHARDFRAENAELFAVPSAALPGAVKNYQFTDVAAFQLAGGVDDWEGVQKTDIVKYSLAR